MYTEPNNPEPIRRAALVTCYGANDKVRLVEVSIMNPATREIVAHKEWDAGIVDEVTDEIVAFAESYHAHNILFTNGLLAMSEFGGKCSHCGGQKTRVSWGGKGQAADR